VAHGAVEIRLKKSSSVLHWPVTRSCPRAKQSKISGKYLRHFAGGVQRSGSRMFFEPRREEPRAAKLTFRTLNRLLEPRYAAMPKCMRSTIRQSQFLENRLQHVPIDVSTTRGVSLRLEKNPAALSNANVLLQHRHRVRMNIDVPITRRSLPSRFNVPKNAPSNVDYRIVEIQILDIESVPSRSRINSRSFHSASERKKWGPLRRPPRFTK
jgi:hypothetical protein